MTRDEIISSAVRYLRNIIVLALASSLGIVVALVWKVPEWAIVIACGQIILVGLSATKFLTLRYFWLGLESDSATVNWSCVPGLISIVVAVLLNLYVNT